MPNSYQNNLDLILELLSRTISYKQQDANPIITIIITDVSQQTTQELIPLLSFLNSPFELKANTTRNGREQQQQNKSTHLKRRFDRIC